MASGSDDFNYGSFGVVPNASLWTVDSGSWSTAWEGSAMSITSTAAAFYRMRYTATAPATADYDVVTPAQSYGDTAYIGPGARLTSGGNGYAAIVRGGYGLQLVRLDAGVGTVLATGSTSLTVNTYYSITLRVSGATIAVLVDGAPEVSVTDSTYSAAGHAGAVAYGGDAGYGSRLDSFSFADAVVEEMPDGIYATDPLPQRPWFDFYSFRDIATPGRAATTDIPIQSSAAPTERPWHIVSPPIFLPGWTAAPLEDGAAAFDEAGEALTQPTAAGGDTADLVDAGQALTQPTATGLDSLALTEAGQASATATAGGLDAPGTADAGQAVSALTATAADALALVDDGQAAVPLAASAADVAALVDAGQGTAATVASAADAIVLVDAGGSAAAASAGAVDVLTIAETGAGVTALTASGVGSGADVLLLIDAGQALGTATAAALDTLGGVDAGGAVLTGAAGAADIQAISETGGGVLALLASALDALGMAGPGSTTGTIIAPVTTSSVVVVATTGATAVSRVGAGISAPRTTTTIRAPSTHSEIDP